MAMYNNRCPHFDEGILPICRKKHHVYCVAKISTILRISLLIILLPRISESAAPKYETAYACEGKTLTIECDPGDLISLIRANYGRFSITICNDHGNVEWSVNCMSPKSLRVLHSKCAHKQNCSVLASTNMFGDPCPGTHKYLEAHYQCMSAAQTSTTTNRPSPPWLITSQPNIWSTSTIRTSVTTARIGSIHEMVIPHTVSKQSSSSSSSSVASNVGNNTAGSSNSSGNNNGANSSTNSSSSSTEIHLAGRPPSGGDNSRKSVTTWNSGNNIGGGGGGGGGSNSSGGVGGTKNNFSRKIYRPTTSPSSGRLGVLQSTKMNSTIIKIDPKDGGGGGGGSSHGNKVSIKNNGTIFTSGDKQTVSTNNNGNQGTIPTTTSPSSNVGSGMGEDNSINNAGNGGSGAGGGSGTGSGTGDHHHHHHHHHQSNQIQTTQSSISSYETSDSNYYCGPTTARNLFWNITRVGEVNVQPCPGGATGIAKWRCVLVQRNRNQDTRNGIVDSDTNTRGDCGKYCDTNGKGSRIDNNNGNDGNNVGGGGGGGGIGDIGLLQPSWHPATPDLTQCRSLWLNNLEIRVNQRDSSLISIANDLSQVTSSKTLYGGDMLVTTKIIQTMSEKMTYDIVTFPDQRQREAIIYELLHGVVKTGSNLLDVSQQVSWLDLSFEDQMRVATSLLTGLEDNAFLLADTIIRERNVVQKVKNILLSVRVLETRNIVSNEIFPDAKLEQWQVSDDQIELPRGALIENSEGGLVRIVFVAFDRLESILKPSYDNLDVKFSTNYIQKSIYNQTTQPQRIRILNSKVISASLGKGRHIQLSQPIRLVLRHLKTENVTNPTCVFWNYIDHAWSEDGCYLETTNRTHTICMCNHLTNFAILMDIVDEHNNSLLSMFDSNMRILIYISIAICILFIIIAILTLKLFNGVFVKSTRTSIYKNIYVCLFIIEILFLLGIEQSEMSLFCGFTTTLLHCFILSAIAWLFYEGFQLYVTLTTDDMLLEVENSSKMIWHYLVSYGLSFSIVAISLFVDPSSYTQGDFCVLMESNGLFYATFATPIILFIVGDIGYTILACYILCKKNKTTLKNKEHSRLTSVRFDLRCSFIFLIILSADWIFGYFYLRKAKIEENVSNTYGYLFISFNSLLGIYIFIFHCIQNEKIRREYRKYVRQNSWLPKCLRCSKTSSISSVTSHHNQNQHYGTAASKKSPITLPIDSTAEGIVAGGTPKSSSSIPTYNETSGTCIVTGGGGGAGVAVDGGSGGNGSSSGGGGSVSGVIGDGGVGGVAGALQQHIAQNSGIGSISRSHRHNIILERAAGGTLRTPSVGHTSPTSSAGSTHLIFNSTQNDQDWNYQQPDQYFQSNQTATLAGVNDITNNKNLNTYDDKFLYYDCKSKRLKQHPTNLRHLPQTPHHQQHHSQQQQQQHPQQHEYFYWTEKSNRKKNNSDLKSHKTTDTVHAFYPSYKKTTTTMKRFQSAPTDDDRLSDSDFPDIENERKYFRFPNTLKHQQQLQQLQQQQQQQLQQQHPQYHLHHHQQQQQHSSDEDHPDAHLIHSGASSSHPSECYPDDMPSYRQQQQQHHYNRYKHPSCDLSDEFVCSIPSAGGIVGGVGIGIGLGGSYYNQSSGPDEPVYEEILNSQMSEMCDDDDDDDDDNDEDDDDNDIIMEEERYNRLRKIIANKEDALRQPFSRQTNKGSFDFNPPKSYRRSPTSHLNSTIDDTTPSHRLQQQQQQQQQPPQQQQQPQPQQQQQIVGRNISAMLDENNTVVCYLEPLPK